jgi:hypothetical protein
VGAVVGTAAEKGQPIVPAAKRTVRSAVKKSKAPSQNRNAVEVVARNPGQNQQSPPRLGAVLSKAKPVRGARERNNRDDRRQRAHAKDRQLEIVTACEETLFVSGELAGSVCNRCAR